ncbi:MAG: pyridoxine 5'-phosphate synthase [Kiritimatiellia bacterium]
MIRLGVNIDHVATLREVRRAKYPSITEAAALCELAGAHGITVHLREDRRHIQDADLYALREMLSVNLNLEMANNADVVAVALDLVPAEVCMVPERREELTTEGGLDVAGHLAELKPVVGELSAAGIEVSMFIDPDLAQVEASAAVGAPCIELHTGTYAQWSGADRERELQRLITAAQRASSIGLKVNAGHGLTLENVGPILALPKLNTLNIGHSIVSHAVFVGLEQAVRAMLELIGSVGDSVQPR